MNGPESFNPGPEVRRKYRQIIHHYLDTLAQAIERTDLETVGMVAHKIQGNAGLFGHPDLGLLARDLQTAVTETDLRAVQQILGRLRDYFAQYLEEQTVRVELSTDDPTRGKLIAFERPDLSDYSSAQ